MRRNRWVRSVIALAAVWHLGVACINSNVKDVVSIPFVAQLYADTHNWDGSASGDWGAGDNWEEGSAPATGDTAIVNYGAVNIDNGLDQSAVNLGQLIVGESYSGILGASTTNPLIIGATTVLIEGGGSNTYLYTGTTYNYDNVHVTKVGSGKQALWLRGPIETLVVKWGDVTIGGSDVCTNAFLEPVANNLALIDFHAGSVKNLYQRAAVTFLTTGTVTNLYLDLGTATLSPTATVTNLHQRGGTFYYNWTTTIAEAAIYGGTFDASGLATPRTITTLVAHEGSAIDLGQTMGNITLTNGIVRYGGTLVTPMGMDVNY